jgi:hypothetical protein
MSLLLLVNGARAIVYAGTELAEGSNVEAAG